ncbi:UNVERIFIED_CONTAM: hypothetical protein HDU68_002545, partial [Siphonaria sp. JEL0065]
SIASKQFTPFLIHSPVFAKKHFKTAFRNSCLPCIWCFLHQNNIKRHPDSSTPSIWDSIPQTYRIFIYKEILISNTCKCPTGARVDARYWALGHKTALKVMNQLLTSPFPSFDPSMYKSRAIRWAALNFNVETVELLLRDPRVDPSECDNEAILSCALSHVRSRELLMVLLGDERVDPKAIDHLLLRNYSTRGNDALICVLLRDERMKNVLHEGDEILEMVLTNGGVSVWKLCLSSSSRIDVNVLRQQVYDKIEAGSIGLDSILEVVIQDGRINLAEDDCFALQLAVENRRGGVLRLLLGDPRVDPSVVENEAVRIASKIGMVEGVRMLLSDPRVDPSALDNEAIRLAAKEGHADVVRLLLMDPRVNSAACGNQAIREAAALGRAAVVALLLLDPRVDPLAGPESALSLACKNHHAEVLDVLVTDRRVAPRLNRSEAFAIARQEFPAIAQNANPASMSKRILSQQQVFEQCIFQFLDTNDTNADGDAFEQQVIDKIMSLWRVLGINPVRDPGLAFQCLFNNWNQLVQSK